MRYIKVHAPPVFCRRDIAGMSCLFRVGISGILYYMDYVKPKGVCEHAQFLNAQIQIYPGHAQSLIRALALHSYIL